MTMPFAVLTDASDEIWQYVRRGEGVPFEVAAAWHDEIADLDGLVSAMEAQLVALSHLGGTPVEFPPVPTIAERLARRHAARSDGNVVRPDFGRPPERPALPRPSHISGCFRVGGPGDAA